MLWTVGVFVLEGAGNPADPETGDRIAEFYRDDRVAILLAATLHGLGGLLFLWFVASLPSTLETAGAPRWLANAMLVGGTAGGALMLALTGGQSTGATTDSKLLTPDTPRAATARPASLAGVVRSRHHRTAPDPADRLGGAALPVPALAHPGRRAALASGYSRRSP